MKEFEDENIMNAFNANMENMLADVEGIKNSCFESQSSMEGVLGDAGEIVHSADEIIRAAFSQ